MDTLTVLLVEDDENTCSEFLHHADICDDIAINKVTNDSEEALEFINNYIPDVLILDLELHNGGGCGLDILQKMHEINIPYPPYVLITTNNSSKVTLEYARQLGADLILSKHQKNYSESYVLSLLKAMKSAIKNRTDNALSVMSTTETPENRRKRIMQQINKELDLVGISTKVIGYQYLSEAIYLAIDKQTSQICKSIAAKYGKTQTSVERAIQNAIFKVWTSSDADNYTKYYTAKVDADRGAPTITEFISYYATKIKNLY